MPYEINETHDPNLKSWVESANDPNTDFPIQNLPLCAFSKGSEGEPTIGTVIGDKVLDLEDAFHIGSFPEISGNVFEERGSTLRFYKRDLR